MSPQQYIIINAGGYVTSGANASLPGTIFAWASYISSTAQALLLAVAAGTLLMFAVNGGVFR